MSDHEDVLRRTLECCRAWDRDVRLLGNVRQGDMADAIDATLAELAALRAEVGILSAAKAGARYIAERDTLRQRLAEVERERDDLRGELASVLRDWNALVHAIGSPTHGGAAGHARILRERADRAERAETALRPFAAFADAWDRKPIRGIHDEVYAIHAGADRGVLRLSDCKAARAALAPVAEPSNVPMCPEPTCRLVSRRTACRGYYVVPGKQAEGYCHDCGHPRVCHKPTPVAEQPQPAIPHMLLVLTHKQTTGGCARCGKDWPCPDAPQPAKASTEPAACTSCGGTRLLTSGHGYRPCHCSQDDGGVPHV
jgi:hypothetical protein